MQGHWEYQGLPFGLKMDPPTFQKMVNSVFSGLTNTHCFTYLDDIVIYYRSLADHNNNLWQVINSLHTYRLKLQSDKCEHTSRGDYCKCVQPPQPPVLTCGSSTIPPGTTSWYVPHWDCAGHNNAATTNWRWLMNILNISLSISFSQDEFVKFNTWKLYTCTRNKLNKCILNSCYKSLADVKVSKVVYLRIKVFWDTMLCHQVYVCLDCPTGSLQTCQSALTKCYRQHSTTSQ